MAMYLGEVFAGCVVHRGIGGVQEWTSRACLTGTLTKEFAGDMLSVYGQVGSSGLARTPWQKEQRL